MKIKYLLLCGLLVACAINITNLEAQTEPPGQQANRVINKNIKTSAANAAANTSATSPATQSATPPATLAAQTQATLSASNAAGSPASPPLSIAASTIAKDAEAIVKDAAAYLTAANTDAAATLKTDAVTYLADTTAPAATPPATTPLSTAAATLTAASKAYIAANTAAAAATANTPAATNANALATTAAATLATAATAYIVATTNASPPNLCPVASPTSTDPVVANYQAATNASCVDATAAQSTATKFLSDLANAADGTSNAPSSPQDKATQLQNLAKFGKELKTIVDEAAAAQKANGYVNQNPPTDATHNAKPATTANATDNAKPATTDNAIANAENDANDAKTQDQLAQKALNRIDPCPATTTQATDSTTNTTTTTTTYSTVRVWFPLYHANCQEAAKQAYFNVAGTATVANQVQYLYNAQQSTNQLTADLLTTTFAPGIQVVLAGTATTGSSQTSTSGSGSTATTTTSDSTATAIAKLQQGGDFNIRGVIPVMNYSKTNFGISLDFNPNLGFTINGIGGQNTITESTQYSGNFPFEVQGQFGSYQSSSTQASVYFDGKVGEEWISSALASNLNTRNAFTAGQLAAGLLFNNSIRIGFQYFIGPSNIYCQAGTSSTCTAPSTTPTGSSGFHLVLSFSPSTSTAKAKPTP